jgi:hypothetical protein
MAYRSRVAVVVALVYVSAAASVAGATSPLLPAPNQPSGVTLLPCLIYPPAHSCGGSVGPTKVTGTIKALTPATTKVGTYVITVGRTTCSLPGKGMLQGKPLAVGEKVALLCLHGQVIAIAPRR